MGERGDGVSHAIVGEQWLDRHLKEANKTREDLARFLYEHRLTAVAEVNILLLISLY
jgi:tRNA ligase